MITYELLNRYKNITHFCTTRVGGASSGNYASFNLSPFTGDTPDTLTQNRLKLCSQIGIKSERLIIPLQNHGTEIREIKSDFLDLSESDKISFLNGVDSLVTNQTGICIGITTADCVPIFLFDPVKNAIAAVHAGWRGTCNRIAEKTVQYFVNQYKSNPADILAVIGPSISANVYEIGNEVVESFINNGFICSDIFIEKNQSIYLDLWEANVQSLKSSGIIAENIEVAGICTFTQHEEFFSARRLGIKSGRILSGIMIN